MQELIWCGKLKAKDTIKEPESTFGQPNRCVNALLARAKLDLSIY